jgi:hypothetical protein
LGEEDQSGRSTDKQTFRCRCSRCRKKKQGERGRDWVRVVNEGVVSSDVEASEVDDEGGEGAHFQWEWERGFVVLRH